jgi:hypothetical protein
LLKGERCNQYKVNHQVNSKLAQHHGGEIYTLGSSSDKQYGGISNSNMHVLKKVEEGNDSFSSNLDANPRCICEVGFSSSLAPNDNMF